MSGLPGLEKSANDWPQRTRDGSVLPSSEIDLVTVPLPNRLQHGLNPFTPRFGAEIGTGVPDSRDQVIRCVVLLAGRVEFRRIVQPILNFGFGAPRESRLQSGRWGEVCERGVQRGSQFVSQKANPTASEWRTFGSWWGSSGKICPELSEVLQRGVGGVAGLLTVLIDTECQPIFPPPPRVRFGGNRPTRVLGIAPTKKPNGLFRQPQFFTILLHRKTHPFAS